MAIRWLLGIAALASFSAASPSTAMPQSAAAADRENPATADLVVRGRILEESSEPLPQTPGTVLLASLWTYRIHVVRVIHGHERSEEIVAKGTSDPELRKDVDFVFDLGRNADGTYRVISLRRI